MSLSTKEQLHFELGILMFNLISESEHAAQTSKHYDTVGNVHSILDALQIEDFSLLKSGFFAECATCGIDQDTAGNLFTTSFDVIKHY